MAKVKYTEDLLRAAVAITSSWSELLRHLGLKVSGGNHTAIQGRVKSYQLDTSHYTGKLWSKGLTKNNNASIAASAEKIRWPDEKVFSKDSAYPSSSLRKRLLEIGWAYKCSIVECSIAAWLDKPITLHVDHINGDHHDNRLGNLRFLCPNCHQQTTTWGNKKRQSRH